MIHIQEDGMDYKRFWKDDEIAHRDNCFCPEAKQVALGIRMSSECVFAELGEEGDPWGITEPSRLYDLNKRYNDRAEKVVGRRLLAEEAPEGIVEFPYVKRIGEVFGGRYEMGEGTGEWLHSPAETPAELEALLDRVEALDLVSFMLPEVWEHEKKRIFEETGKRPEPLRHIRGPVTLATSLYGVENLIFLSYDAPELFERFGRVIGDTILKMAAIQDREAGYGEGEAPRGFSFADDDCSLMTPGMYEVFGYPVLERVFERYSPDPGDMRFQHSDSAMSHLLPQLAKLNLTGCNFGPTVLVNEIRTHMPRTRIDGCMAPFTFMSNDAVKIREEVKRDCEAIKATGTRGLNIFTAGSINNGSSLESLRVVMDAILEFGRY